MKFRSKDFRPRIPDETKRLRRRFEKLKRATGLNKAALGRKMAEAGLNALEDEAFAEANREGER